jgi:long-subunit acyl-CoA synthetase (AMP-forming)
MDEAPWFRNYEQGVPRSIPDPEITLPEEGELEVRGPQVMLGYWGEEERAPEAPAP